MSDLHPPTQPARPPAVRDLRSLGLEPDPWQVEVLEAGHPRLLLNCCRQAGKSTVVALLGLVEALFMPGTQGAAACRAAIRQSAELFRIVTDFYRRLRPPLLERADAARAGAGQPQPHRLPAVQRGDHPRLRPRQPAGHRRGRPRARRPVPRRPAHAGRLAAAG